jgi:type IV pilus assembly protein PilC
MNEPRMFEPARRVAKTGVQGNYGSNQAAPAGLRPAGLKGDRAMPGDQQALAQDFDPLDISKSATGFDYKGIDSLGVQISGFVQTTAMDLAMKELRRAGIEVTSLSPRKMLRQKAKKPSMLEFAQLAEQFGDLMEIGENPVQVCRLLAYSQTNKYLQEALLAIGERVMNGWTLSEAFSSVKDDKGEMLFPVTLICALRIGEEVGSAKDSDTGESTSAFLLTLKRFSEAQKKSDAIRSQIRGALMYPIAVIIFCVLASGIVLYFVMPRMVELYTGLFVGQNAQLPLVTRILIGASDFLLSWWGLGFIVLVILGLIYFVTWVRTPQGADRLKVMALSMPVFGQFFRHYYAAQTLRTLALLSAGIPSIGERFAIAAETSENPVYAEMLLHIRDRLLIESIDLSKLFMPYPWLMGKEFQGVVMTFEKTADMQGTFHNYAKVVETRAERELEGVLFWLQNFAIVPVGAFVAFILVALYSPMFELASRINQR